MNESITKDIERVLVTEDEIKNTVKRLAGEINAEYSKDEKNLLLLGILKGSVMVMSELMKYIEVPLTIDFMKVSSYGEGSVSYGVLNVLVDLNYDNLEDYDILVVEDIVDTGNTLSYLLSYLKDRGAKSVKLCTLLDKPDRREKEVHIDFHGIKIENEFVVGFGLDYAEKYRNLPYIGVLKKEIYTK